MEVLASLSIGTVATLMVLLAWLGFILDMNEGLILEFMSTMSETTSITKFTVASELPVLAEFGFVLSFVVFNKESSFLDSVKLFAFGANIYLKSIWIR